jgi:biotin carboxylase
MTTRSIRNVSALPDQHRDRVLVIAPHGSYRTSAFIQAAKNLNVDVLIASQGEHSIVSEYVLGLHIDQHYGEEALKIILAEAAQYPFTAVIGTDDVSTELAAMVAAQLNLPHNPATAVKITQRKDLARIALKQSGVNIPAFQIINSQLPLSEQWSEHEAVVKFPAVIKPVALSASRGVIRVNNKTELQQAIERIKTMMEAEQQIESSVRQTLLLEAFIPGVEVAVEAMLYNGELDILTIFDKPDPLDGPYFEETYYLTPSSHSAEIQLALKRTIHAACQAYGLTQGPVHAECRINEQGIWVLEVAARTIGGLCGQLLNLGTGYSLEELVLLHGMGKRVSLASFETSAGVLMIPIPGAGILKRVEGLLDAQRIPYINEVSIQVREGYELVPLPEGNSYLGFIFAQAPTVKEAEQALRDAHACLKFVLAPLWKIAGKTHAMM